MTLASGKQLAVGLRRAVIFKLDANGYPAAPSTSVYEGFEVIGPKAYALTIPDVRKITHVGNDRALAVDFLPPTEASSAELRVAADDNELNAYLSGVKSFAVGEASMMGLQTDLQGSEPDVGILLAQQSLDAATKLRNYRFHIIPKGRCIPMPPGMDENAAELRYAVAPNPTTKHLWGTALAALTEGALEAAFVNGMSAGRPNIVAYKGNGTEDEFLFPVDKPAIATVTAKVVVWVNGVLQVITTDYTVTTTTLTFTPGSIPANGEMVVAFYEY